MDLSDYVKQAQQLLPPGLIWEWGSGATGTALLEALCQSFADADASAAGLLDEADWRTTLYLLDDWERVAGLPDPCVDGAGQTVAQRRAWLVSRMTMAGGQSRQFFIDLAATFGVAITITEYQASDCGWASCGDYLGGDQMNSTWEIEMPATTVWVADCGEAACGDLLGDWQTGFLECLFQRLKPAHTILYITYGGS
jgi:uncharacterized protein YmfQ (DUF2313 family)